MILLQDSNLPGDFFTKGSFATLAGATGIVYAVCNTIQRVFNFNPKWLALLVSIIVSFIGAFITKDEESGNLKYLLAFLNGFLIYMTAAGANQVTAPNPAPVQTKTSAAKREWLAAWF